MFALLLASTLELTFGSLGKSCLPCHGNEFPRWPRLCFGRDLDGRLGDCQAEARRDDRNDSRAVVYFDTGRFTITLGYIAWCVPRRMALLAQKERLPRPSQPGALGLDRASVCFAVAMALPTAWPWSVISHVARPVARQARSHRHHRGPDGDQNVATVARRWTIRQKLKRPVVIRK